MDLSDITRLISSLRAQTARDSITPNGLGSILQRIVDAISSMSGIDVEDEEAILQRLSAAESNASTALQAAQNAQAGAAGNVIDSFTQSQDEDEVSLSIKQHGHSAKQVVLPAASSTGAGIMTATDKSHLDTAYGKRVNLMSAPSSESMVTLTITFGDGTTKTVTFVGATAGTGGKAGLMTKEQADQLAALVAAGPAESVRDDAGYLKQQYAAPIILRNVSDTVFDDLAIGDIYYDSGHLFYHAEGESGDPDIGAPSRKVIYYCLADQMLYRWTGSRFVQAVSISSGDIAVPTKLSDLVNDMGFITSVKTINGQTITGTGNITIDGAAELKDASNHIKQGMAAPVVLRNVTATSLDNLQIGDVYFDSGHLFCHVSASSDVDLDTPSKSLIYFCLADNSYYRWTGSSFTKINSGGDADQQLDPNSDNAVSNAAVCGGLASKANSSDVYPKSQTYSKGEVDDLVDGIEAGERIVFDTEGTPIIDSPLSPNADTVLGAASARWVKELDNNVKAILAALANIAFTTGKPTWQAVAKRKYDLTMNASTLTGCTGTVVSGDAGNGQVYEGGVRIKLTPSQASYAFTSVTVNGNSVPTTSADDGLGSVYIDIIVNGNITVAATAVSGRGIDFTGSTGCLIGAAGVAIGQDLDTTITANEHFTLPSSITVKIGNTNVAHTYTRAQGNKTATLHIDAANITGDLTITCEADEDAHVTLAISGTNFVVKQGNTELSNGSKVYNGSAAQTLTIEPASGYKFSTLPSADKGTMTNNGPYEASSLEIGTSVEGTLTITAAGSSLSQNCQITLPSTGSGIASVALTDLNGTAITSPVVEGTGIKIVLTPDTDFTISTISIANMTEGADYNVTDNNGVKTITIQHVTGNVVVSATTSQPTELRLNLKWFNEPTAQEKVITEGARFTLDLIPLFNDKSYKFIAAATQDAGTENEKDIRAAVQVIMGGVDISSQSGVVTFDETNNKVTIDIANPVGIVTINATARLRITRDRTWNSINTKYSGGGVACACESMIPVPQEVAGNVKYLYYGPGYAQSAGSVTIILKQNLNFTYWSAMGVYKKIDTFSGGTDYSDFFYYLKPTIGLIAAEGGVISQEPDPNNPVYPYLSVQRKAETGESYDSIPIVPVVTREDFNNALFEDPTD